jgi:leucyl aminopeptidase
MPHPLPVRFVAIDLPQVLAFPGRVALVVPGGAAAPASAAARTIDRATKGSLTRLMASEAWGKLKPGEAAEIGWPAGLAAEALQVVKADVGADVATARKAGSAIGRAAGKAGVTVVAGRLRHAAELALAASLRAYDFTARKSAPGEAKGDITVMSADPAAAAAAFAPLSAVAEGVVFTRDLVNEPANVLSTTEFARRLETLRDLGLTVEVLEESDLERLGMRTLLAVGQGSESPSKVVVMQWRGGGDEQPFALVGKGVVFDTGGISIKPAAGMEEMTMDMGGAGVVAGVMKTLALRRARANVVGLVGLVENMPDGRAQRPGDIVTSMKGDTVEVINTDAEGRLVLADVLWYAQDRFKPAGMVDLATLTGAIIIALGHENAGVFSNNDDLANAFLKAASAEGEGAWRMPMGQAYDDKLKSRLADMMNVGGRDGGAITAAQFLARFVKPEVPWVHLDIAGTALLKSDSALAPKGATGWGVMALNRLIADRYEAK